MGTDIQVAVGRIKPSYEKHRFIDNRPADLNAAGFTREMFEIWTWYEAHFEKGREDLPIEVKPTRNNDLFSWLGTWRNEFRPLPQTGDNTIWTKAFLEWYDPECDTLLRESFGSVMFSLDFLLSFDYDQIVEVEDAEFFCEERREQIITYKKDPEGRTYRQCFEGSEFLEFIQEAKEKGWQFVIFSFN